MKKLALVAVLLAVAAAGAAAQRDRKVQFPAQDGDASSRWDARIADFRGDVAMQAGDDEDHWLPLAKDLPLGDNDKIKTGADGYVEIALDGEGLVEIGPKSMMQVSSLYHSNAVFSLDFGSILAKIKELASRRRTFTVTTPTAMCAVRGTEFAIEYSPEEKSTVVAVFDEGAVQVSGKTAGTLGGVLLTRNQEASVDIAGERIEPVPLEKLTPQKSRIARIRTKISMLKAKWKALGAEERAALREKTMHTLRLKLGLKEPAGKTPKLKSSFGQQQRRLNSGEQGETSSGDPFGSKSINRPQRKTK